jgi:peptidyl-tRNA hydrolase, PTH1 family
VPIFGRRRRSDDATSGDGRILLVGLGNPGKRYEGTRHNVGAEVVAELSCRWELPRARRKFNGLLSEGRIRPGGPRVATLLPQTYMNESGRCVGPARGALHVPLGRLIAVYDEIDLPFGDVRSKLGGGTAGHNGIKSLRDGLGSADFWRIRVGVGRPDTTDPEIVAAHVLGRFREPDSDVRELIASAAEETDRLVERLASPADE